MKSSSGDTGGVDAHGHPHTGNTGTYTGAPQNTLAGDLAIGAHSHSMNHTHTNVDNKPLHRSLLLCKKD